jgi:hypothetical protein
MVTENIKRNKELVELRKSDIKKWSFNALSRYFKITPQAAQSIWKRFHLKYGGEDGQK